MTHLKPEMHDIGKLLIDSQIKHNFENLPIELKNSIKMNPVWEGILQHHCSEDFDEYPKNFQTFILSIADGVASATSRHSERIKGEPRYNVYKLWSPPQENIHDLSKVINEDITNNKWISKIIEFVNKDPSTNEFFEIFERYLRDRAEDSYPGSNITSLLTHCKLTGLFYNFLYDYLDKIDDNWFINATKDDIKNCIIKTRKNKMIKITRIKINFPQGPIRIRDLNVFDVLSEIKNNIQTKYPNNVIYVGFNEILLILTLDKDFEELRDIVSKYGFWCEIIERKENLDQPFPDPDRIMRKMKKINKIQQKIFEEALLKIRVDKRNIAEKNIRKNIYETGNLAKEINNLKLKYKNEINNKIYQKSTIYGDLDSEISPPICELCQMKQATEKWEDEDSRIIENLCINCFNIRNRGVKFSKLTTWEKYGADRVLWIKIDLNIDELISVLEDLYADYLRTLGKKNPEKEAEIRFSVLSEFDWDYKRFIDEFTNELKVKFGKDNFQQILEEFISLKIERLHDVYIVLKIFDELFTKYFPKFKETKSPIKLGLICSNIKYPFLECWRVLSSLEEEITITLIGKGEIKLQMSQLTPLLNLDLRNKTLIHKLTELSKISYKLAEIILYDRTDKDYKKYQQLRESIQRFGFQNISIYSEIIGG